MRLFPFLAALVTIAPASAQVVFSTDFEAGLPAEFHAPGAVIEGVQGYAGLGSAGRSFSGQFLRYSDTQLQPTTLTLTGLPAHTHIDIEFLLAVIDSWDGTELMEVRVDGVPIFSHWFQLALGDSSSYVAPPGTLLSSGTNLGFSAGTYFSRDRAYDLGSDPAFLGIPHTSSTVTVDWFVNAVSGTGSMHWQGGTDESWGIDSLSVSVGSGSASIGTPYCGPAVPNVTGASGSMSAIGSTDPALNDVTLRASNLPANVFGFFMVSRDAGLVTQPGGSQGNLCLGGAIGRYVGPGQIGNSGPSGQLELVLDLAQTPQPTGAVSIVAGETWRYQAWYRDSVMGTTTSNFTDGLEISYL